MGSSVLCQWVQWCGSNNVRDNILFIWLLVPLYNCEGSYLPPHQQASGIPMNCSRSHQRQQRYHHSKSVISADSGPESASGTGDFQGAMTETWRSDYIPWLRGNLPSNHLVFNEDRLSVFCSVALLSMVDEPWGVGSGENTRAYIVYTGRTWQPLGAHVWRNVTIGSRMICNYRHEMFTLANRSLRCFLIQLRRYTFHQSERISRILRIWHAAVEDLLLIFTVSNDAYEMKSSGLPTVCTPWSS